MCSGSDENHFKETSVQGNRRGDMIYQISDFVGEWVGPTIPVSGEISWFLAGTMTVSKL